MPKWTRRNGWFADSALREQDSNPRFPTSSMVQKSADFVPRYQKFESISLQRRVNKLSVPFALWRYTKAAKTRFIAPAYGKFESSSLQEESLRTVGSAADSLGWGRASLAAYGKFESISLQR